MSEILDPIERGEARAERYAERIDGDMYSCPCGRKCVIYDAEILSPDPYGEPFCPTCAEEFFRSQKENEP